MTLRLLVVVVVELQVVEMYANGFIRPSRSSAGAQRQAAKGLIFPEDFLLADASMVFHLQQCRHTICFRGTYSAADNQAGRTLERRPKGQIVARSWRSKISPSRSPLSIQITTIFWYQRSRYRADRMPTGSLGHPSHQEVFSCFSTGSRTDPFGCASGDSITWPRRTDLLPRLPRISLGYSVQWWFWRNFSSHPLALQTLFIRKNCSLWICVWG